MSPALTLKPDFPRTIARFDAWWQGEIIDRPPVTLSVVPTRPYRGLRKEHGTAQERRLDVESTVASAIAWMECTDFVGDSFPVFRPSVGPEVSATLFGSDLEWGEHATRATTVVHQPADWQQILERTPSFDNPYWKLVEQLTTHAIERCEGRYIVGITDLYGNYDILASLREPQQLCLDLVDHPDRVRQAGRMAARAFVQAFRRSYDPIAAAGFGSVPWCPAYHSGPACVIGCDFWGMVSPGVAREFVWPEILEEMQPLERRLFHLDGPQALKHLNLLLECPQLDAVQWVYGDGYGRAQDWIPLYGRIRQAGKSVQVRAADAADALAVLGAIGAKGVWIDVLEPFASVAEANRFLQEVEKAAAHTHANRPAQPDCEFPKK